MNKLCLISVLFWTLSGCATKSITKNYTLDSQGNHGVVVVSVTKSGHGRTWSPSYNFHQLDGEFKGGILKMKTDIFERIVSDFSQVDGNLHVVDLPQGEYRISRWYVHQGMMGIESLDGFDIRFNVEPGKVTYLGELSMKLTSGGLFNLGVGDVVVQVKDAYERDLGVVKRDYPKLDISDVQSGLLNIISLQ